MFVCLSTGKEVQLAQKAYDKAARRFTTTRTTTAKDDRKQKREDLARTKFLYEREHAAKCNKIEEVKTPDIATKTNSLGPGAKSQICGELLTLQDLLPHPVPQQGILSEIISCQIVLLRGKDSVTNQPTSTGPGNVVDIPSPTTREFVIFPRAIKTVDVVIQMLLFTAFEPHELLVLVDNKSVAELEDEDMEEYRDNHDDDDDDKEGKSDDDNERRDDSKDEHGGGEPSEWDDSDMCGGNSQYTDQAMDADVLMNNAVCASTMALDVNVLSPEECIELTHNINKRALLPTAITPNRKQEGTYEDFSDISESESVDEDYYDSEYDENAPTDPLAAYARSLKYLSIVKC